MSDDSDEETTLVLPPRKRSSKTELKQKSKKNKNSKFDLDLAEVNVPSLIPDFRINLSKSLEMYIKEFKGSHYLGFGRRDENGGDPKYHFNIPLSLFPKIKEGIKAIDKLMKQQE